MARGETDRRSCCEWHKASELRKESFTIPGREEMLDFSQESRSALVVLIFNPSFVKVELRPAKFRQFGKTKVA